LPVLTASALGIFSAFFLGVRRKANKGRGIKRRLPRPQPLLGDTKAPNKFGNCAPPQKIVSLGGHPTIRRRARRPQLILGCREPLSPVWSAVVFGPVCLAVRAWARASVAGRRPSNRTG